MHVPATAAGGREMSPRAITLTTEAALILEHSDAEVVATYAGWQVMLARVGRDHLVGF